MIYPLVKYVYKGAKFVNSARKNRQKKYEEENLRTEHQAELDEIREKSEKEFDTEGSQQLYDYIDLLAEEFGFDFDDETKHILVDHLLHQANENEKDLRKEVDDEYEERLEEIEDEYEEENSWLSVIFFAAVIAVGIYGVKVLYDKASDFLLKELPDMLSDLDFSFGFSVGEDGSVSTTTVPDKITSSTKEFRAGVESVFDVKGVGWVSDTKKGTGKLRISTEFGAVDTEHPTPHSGIDIPMPDGTIMYAPFDGIVTTSYHNGGGNQMFLEGKFNGKNVRIGMAHLKGYLVKSGTRVTKGTPICTVGNTGGHTTGSHVHFTYREEGVLKDPKEFFYLLGAGEGRKYKADATPSKLSLSTPKAEVKPKGEVEKLIASGNANPQRVSVAKGQSQPSAKNSRIVETAGLPAYDEAWFRPRMSQHGVKYWNLGNIKKPRQTSYQGVVGTHTTTDSKGVVTEWLSFSNPYYGIIGMAQIIRKHDGKTINTMMHEYAPTSENDTEYYLKMIEMFTNLTRDMVIVFKDLEFMALLIYAMVRKENSVVLPVSYIKQCLVKGYPDVYMKHPSYSQFNITSITPMYRNEVYPKIDTVS